MAAHVASRLGPFRMVVSCAGQQCCVDNQSVPVADVQYWDVPSKQRR
jgi:hypothetical protein